MPDELIYGSRPTPPGSRSSRPPSPASPPYPTHADQHEPATTNRKAHPGQWNPADHPTDLGKATMPNTRKDTQNRHRSTRQATTSAPRKIEAKRADVKPVRED